MSNPFPSSSSSTTGSNTSSSSSSTSSSSSSSRISSSSSSSSDPCGGIACQWELTAYGPVALSGCRPGCRCPEPTGLIAPRPQPTSFAPATGDIVTTACVPRAPIPLPSTSSSSSSTPSTSSPMSPMLLISPPLGSRIQSTSATETVFIDVPNVLTGELQGFIVEVKNGFHIFRGVGWTVTLVKLPTARSKSSVIPTTIPASIPSISGVLAGVTLPETAGSFQYWVPVLESHLGAALQSREWTVIFHKIPHPPV